MAVNAPEDLLRNVAFFQSLDRVDIARMIGELEEVSVGVAGGERPLAELEAPASFGELGLLLARRTSAVRAVTEIRAWKLPATASSSSSASGRP